MKRLFTSILIAITSISLNAVKLNQRGEKMVSEIRIEYTDSTKRFPYTIKFGYDMNSREITSLVYERNGAGNKIVRLKRDKDGKIISEDFFDGQVNNKYKFQTNADGKPTEMIWYEKNIYGKFHKTYTFCYDYGFNGYDLSIVSFKSGSGGIDKRDLVKVENGCVFSFYNGINQNKGTEGIPKQSITLAYGERIDDVNIDVYQILRGYCSVAINSLNELGSNFIFLVKWVTVGRVYLPTFVNKYDIEYVEYDGNVVKINVKYENSSDVFYTITLKYVE